MNIINELRHKNANYAVDKTNFSKKNPRLMKNFSYHHRCNANREARCVCVGGKWWIIVERKRECWECLEAIYKQSIYMTAIAARKGSNRNVLICIVRWSLIKITFLRGNFNGCLFRKIWKCPAVSNNDIQIATTTLRNFPTAIIAWLTAISPLSFISFKKIICEGDLIWYAYYNNRASLRLQQINKRIKMKNRNLHFPQLQFVVEFCCHSKITQFFSYIK